MFASLHRELPRHGDHARLGRRVRQRGKGLETQETVQRSGIHDHAVARFQMRPCRAGEVEHQVHLLPAIAIPFFIGDVFDPVEVRHRGVVEQHVDPAERGGGEIDERLAVGWLREMARLQRNHRSSRGPNHIDCGLGGIDGQIAADDPGAFSSECPRGFAADAPAGASDDADLSGKPR
jgi:hypothetical protein